MTWILTFFSDLFYILAMLALVGGIALYGVSYVAKWLPVIATYALMMQVGGIVLALGGGYFVAEHKGYEKRVAEDKAEIDRLNAEARQKEAELAQTLKEKTAALRKATNAISQKQVVTNQRIDAGELHFNTSCPVQASSDAGTPAGNPENGTQSEREILKTINDITTQGDTAIIRLNACIDQYNEVKGKVNAQQ